MPLSEFGSLGDLSADGSTEDLVVARFEEVVLLIGGAFVATLQTEIRMQEGDTYVPFGVALAAPGQVTINIPVFQLRVTMSGHTSGTAEIRYGLRDFDRTG